MSWRRIRTVDSGGGQRKANLFHVETCSKWKPFRHPRQPHQFCSSVLLRAKLTGFAGLFERIFDTTSHSCCRIAGYHQAKSNHRFDFRTGCPICSRQQSDTATAMSAAGRSESRLQAMPSDPSADTPRINRKRRRLSRVEQAESEAGSSSSATRQAIPRRLPSRASSGSSAERTPRLADDAAAGTRNRSRTASRSTRQSSEDW